MTIAAGFRCPGAIVMCADTEISVGEDLKLGRGKLTIFDGETCKILFSGAGNIEFIRMATQKIVNALPSDPTLHGVRATIEKIVLEVFRNHVRWYPAPEHNKPNFNLLIAAWTKSEGLELFKTSSTAVNKAGWCECEGWGGALGGYLADKLYSVLLEEKEAIALAIYILQQAKTYVPYCGKESSVWILRSDGSWDIARATEVVEHEEYFSEFEEAANDLFLAGYEEQENEKFEERLKDFCDRLRELRESQKVKRETLGFQGLFKRLGSGMLGQGP